MGAYITSACNLSRNVTMRIEEFCSSIMFVILCWFRAYMLLCGTKRDYLVGLYEFLLNKNNTYIATYLENDVVPNIVIKQYLLSSIFDSPQSCIFAALRFGPSCSLFMVLSNFDRSCVFSRQDFSTCSDASNVSTY